MDGGGWRMMGGGGWRCDVCSSDWTWLYEFRWFPEEDDWRRDEQASGRMLDRQIAYISKEWALALVSAPR